MNSYVCKTSFLDCSQSDALILQSLCCLHLGQMCFHGLPACNGSSLSFCHLRMLKVLSLQLMYMGVGMVFQVVCCSDHFLKNIYVPAVEGKLFELHGVQEVTELSLIVQS